MVNNLKLKNYKLYVSKCERRDKKMIFWEKKILKFFFDNKK
jgi:hypothetical protein